MEVIFTPVAQVKLNLLLEYLKSEWSEKSRDKVYNQFKTSINQISAFPKSCNKSIHFPNLYKCVITKHTCLYYRIRQNKIEVITINDSRQNPNQTKLELSKLF